jgi:hypothetical protein
MKLQDITSKIESLKIKWIKQMEDIEYKSTWKSYISNKFKDECINLPHYNYDIANYPTFSDNLYLQLFSTWNKIHAVNIETYEDIYRQNIMNNRHIQVGQEVI